MVKQLLFRRSREINELNSGTFVVFCKIEATYETGKHDLPGFLKLVAHIWFFTFKKVIMLLLQRLLLYQS